MREFVRLENKDATMFMAWVSMYDNVSILVRYCRCAHLVDRSPFFSECTWQLGISIDRLSSFFSLTAPYHKILQPEKVLCLHHCTLFVCKIISFSILGFSRVPAIQFPGTRYDIVAWCIFRLSDYTFAPGIIGKGVLLELLQSSTPLIQLLAGKFVQGPASAGLGSMKILTMWWGEADRWCH